MRSYWLQQALEGEGAEDVPPLAGDLKTDVCIVGGGFTGLWTAIRLKEHEPALDVTIIEGDICGGGASGRNGGFCMTWMSKAEKLLKICGAQEGVDCQFTHHGWIWTASNQAQAGAWSETVEQLERLGVHAYEPLSREEVAARTGSDRHVAGVFEAGVATVQTAMLARGLRRAALRRGVRIHEGTRMTELVRGPKPAVRTARGTVSAETVVLALNAWAHELPEFRRTVMPIAADAVVTEPVPEKLAEIGLADCAAVSDSRFLVNYYRATVDGRMAWGKGGGGFPFAGRVGQSFDGPSPRESEVRAEMAKYYPALAEVPIAAAWRGPATRTKTGLPFFGRLAGSPRIVYGHGYTGNGVGPCYLGGRILASLALDRRDEWAETPLAQGPQPGKLPPEPIRYIGGHMVRTACIRADRAEDEGRKPGFIDRRLAALAPAGLAPTKKD